MEDKKRAASVPHRIVIVERESMTLDGVTNVESFDDEEVVLDTSQGLLILRGKELHIKQLSLDEGSLAIEGYIQGLEYADEGTGKRARGLLGRILR